MNKKDKIVTSAVASILSLMSTNVVLASSSVAATPENEKCYGIVKKGMNDCSTSSQSCAGSSTVDKQGDAFIFLPKGACNKIVGASTQAVVATPKNEGHDQVQVPPSESATSIHDKNIPEEERD